MVSSKKSCITSLLEYLEYVTNDAGLTVEWSECICFRPSPRRFYIQLGPGPRQCSWCSPCRQRVFSKDRGQRCGGYKRAPCQCQRFRDWRSLVAWSRRRKQWRGTNQSLLHHQTLWAWGDLGNRPYWQNIVHRNTSRYPAHWIKRKVLYFVIIQTVFIVQQ